MKLNHTAKLDQIDSVDTETDLLGVSSREPPQIARIISPQGVVSSYVVSWFWESYSPLSNHSAIVRRDPIWLHRAINNPNSVPALKLALLAISFTRYGKTTADVALYECGKRLYSQALQALQTALYVTSVLRNDDLLIAIHVLLIYEVLVSLPGDMN